MLIIKVASVKHCYQRIVQIEMVMEKLTIVKAVIEVNCGFRHRVRERETALGHVCTTKKYQLTSDEDIVVALHCI
jgi:hypothetical protein